MARLALLLACALLFGSGCFASREMARVGHDAEAQWPGLRLEREVNVSLGPLALRTTRWALRRVGDDEAHRAAAYLQAVRRLKVGIYRVVRPPREAGALPLPASYQRPGWEVAVRAHEPDAHTWVLYRERGGAVRDLCILTLSGDELVVARLEGRLDALLEQAVADHAGVAGWVQELR